MQRSQMLRHLDSSLAGIEAWQEKWEPYAIDESLRLSDERVSSVLAELTDRLQENYPYQHPRYAGQMLKPPHEVAMLAYMTAMQINPNNHAYDGGAATSRMELEAIEALARMFGYDEPCLGHLTASGTIANLEALWVARELKPERGIAVSKQAHYTHERACQILAVPYLEVSTDPTGRMELNALQELIDSGVVGTVVATAGTTGMGSVDPIDEILEITRPAGVRLHVDAAYGGFFKLLAERDEPLVNAESFAAISLADSVVVDPHKHGLQPYGCGAVLFNDPNVGRIYQHDSPYTYFTSDELHLGEITLECSRAGAAAAALWATLQCFPLEANRGFGPIMARCRQAALAWAEKINANNRLRLVCQPQLDIICFYAVPNDEKAHRASEITALADHLFASTEADDRPVYLAKFSVSKDLIRDTHPGIIWDAPSMEVIRSVLMKPEQLDWVDEIDAAIDRSLAAY